MVWRVTLALLATLAPLAAYADCSQEVARAYERANALPPSPGRSALLEQIQRAEIAHHEGDEDECVDAVQMADDVLAQIDAAHAQPEKARTPPTRP